MTLTPNQIYVLARQAGFPPDNAAEMTAIALRESSGVTTALNPKAPDYSMGLWQINMLGNLEQSRLGLFNLSRKEDLFDPNVNAAAAYKLWSMAGGSPLRDWYEIPVRFMPQAEAAMIANGEGPYATGGGDGNGGGVDEEGNPVIPDALTPTPYMPPSPSPSPSPFDQISTTLGSLSPAAIAISLGVLMLFVIVTGNNQGRRVEAYD